MARNAQRAQIIQVAATTPHVHWYHVVGVPQRAFGCFSHDAVKDARRRFQEGFVRGKCGKEGAASGLETWLGAVDCLAAGVEEGG